MAIDHRTKECRQRTSKQFEYIMSELSLSQRYDQFQNDAVQSVTVDFSEKPGGRHLLVVPTGGGKTFIAVRSINALAGSGILKRNDRVAWVAHRRELLEQAQDCFDKYVEYYNGVSFKNNVDFMMLAEARKVFAGSTNYKMAIIDEAHHGAAPSYAPMFATDGLGILGLTATPSRHDGVPLAFERESYSIGFPDLVELGVVLRPEVIKVAGGTYEGLTDLSDESLAELMDPERQRRIIAALLARKDEYTKIVIYAGTRDLAKNTYEALSSSELAEHYESIEFVLGNENSLGIERKEFFEIQKATKRSILVNVQVLSEGYDDPAINTIVMAAPTNSKLVYMQALGRAIRHDPNDSSKQSYVLEVEDRLPNIRYRIDNRWLFSDVSDVLEPAVHDRTFATSEQFVDTVEAIFDEYGVEARFRSKPLFEPTNRVTMLLFRYAMPGGTFGHIPIVVDNANRLIVGNAFNFLSQRMVAFAHNVHPEAAFKMVNTEGIDVLGEEINRTLVYNAMESQQAVISGEPTSTEKNMYPWITFVTFRWCRSKNELPEDLVEFARDMVNRDEMLSQIAAGDYEPGFYLIKLPLPLSRSLGRIVTPGEFEGVRQPIAEMCALKKREEDVDHRNGVDAILDGALWPLEAGLIASTVLIVRDGIDYYRELEK